MNMGKRERKPKRKRRHQRQTLLRARQRQRKQQQLGHEDGHEERVYDGQGKGQDVVYGGGGEEELKAKPTFTKGVGLGKKVEQRDHQSMGMMHANFK